MKVNRILLVLIIFSSIFLTGCANEIGVETKAFPIAIGVDVGDENDLKLTFQIAILNGESSSDESASQNTTIISVDCATINSGITLVNSYISKKINLSHCKAIIISEELAYSGVNDVLFSLVNNIEVRPDCNIIVSRCDAYDILKNSNPIFESNPAKYYELILNSAEYTGYVQDLYLRDFYSSILSTTSQACAILGGINTTSTHSDASYSKFNLDDNYKASDTPIESKNNAEVLGTAVFREDKLVGELNNLETLCHLIITDNLEGATITMPNPFNFDTYISVYINLNKSTDNSVTLINNTPYIESNIFLTGNVSSLDTSIDLTDPQNLDTLNDYINSYIEQNVLSYLYKTSRDFKSDIDEFGKYLLPNYLNWEDWLESDWLNNYQNSFFKVEVHTEIQGGYIYTKI